MHPDAVVETLSGSHSGNSPAPYSLPLQGVLYDTSGRGCTHVSNADCCLVCDE